MIIYPAIDLIAGEVVRLHKGDFAQKTMVPIRWLWRGPMRMPGQAGFTLLISTVPRTRQTARQH